MIVVLCSLRCVDVQGGDVALLPYCIIFMELIIVLFQIINYETHFLFVCVWADCHFVQVIPL